MTLQIFSRRYRLPEGQALDVLPVVEGEGLGFEQYTEDGVRLEWHKAGRLEIALWECEDQKSDIEVIYWSDGLGDANTVDAVLLENGCIRLEPVNGESDVFVEVTSWSECVDCGYNLTMNTTGRCPECGRRVPRTK